MVLVSTCGIVDNIINMFSVLIIVAQLIHITYADVQCLQCNDVTHPTDCHSFQKCRPTERCFVDAFLTSFGDIVYDLGCRETEQCDGLKPVVRRIIPEGVNRRTSVDKYGKPMNSGKRSAHDAVLCSNCCDTKLCNSIGCGSNGFSNTRGPICSACVNKDSVDGCNKFTVCRKNEVCMLLKSIDPRTHQPLYETKCEQDQVCNTQFTEYSNIYAMFMGKKFNASLQGSKCSIRCCNTDLCNTECNAPPGFVSQPVQTLPNPLHVASPAGTPRTPVRSKIAKPLQDATGTPKHPNVITAEFVAQPEIHNMHYPKGHHWDPGHAVVTEPLSPFGAYPNNEVHMPQRADPQGMPVYSVSSESPGILAALGISELPGPMNATGNVHVQPSTEGPSRWGPVNAPPPAHSVDRHWQGGSQTGQSFNEPFNPHQKYEPQTAAPRQFDSITNPGTQSNYVQQGNRDSLGITMTSAQNIERTLNSGIQRVYDSGAAQNVHPDQRPNHSRESQTHPNAQNYVGSQVHSNNNPINASPNYSPDQMLNAEAQLFGQQEQHIPPPSPNSGSARDVPRHTGTHRQHIDPPNHERGSLPRSFDQQAQNPASQTPETRNQPSAFIHQSSNPASRNHNVRNPQNPYDQQAPALQSPFDHHAQNSAPQTHDARNSQSHFGKQSSNAASRSHGISNPQEPYNNQAPTLQSPFDQHAQNTTSRTQDTRNSQSHFDPQASNAVSRNKNVRNPQYPYDQQSAFDQHVPSTASQTPGTGNVQSQFDPQNANKASRNENVRRLQRPYDQQKPHLASRNPKITEPRSMYSAEQFSNVNAQGNPVSNRSSASPQGVPAPNRVSDPQYRDSLGGQGAPAQNRDPQQPHMDAKFDFLTDAQRKRVAVVMSSNRPTTNTEASITYPRRGGSGIDASRNVDRYRNPQSQPQPPSPQNNAQANKDLNSRQRGLHSSKPDVNKRQSIQNVEMYQHNEAMRRKSSPVDAHSSGSNRLNPELITTPKTRADRFAQMGGHPGLLNIKENTFTSRNSETPWTNDKKVNPSNQKLARGKSNSRQNMIESTQGNVNRPAPNLKANAKADWRSQRLALASMREAAKAGQQQKQRQASVPKDIPNASHVPAARSHIESTSPSHMQQMADPRSIVRPSPRSEAHGVMPLPELLHPSRNQPPQGIMNVQRITEAPHAKAANIPFKRNEPPTKAPTIDAFNVPFQRYQPQTEAPNANAANIPFQAYELPTKAPAVNAFNVQFQRFQQQTEAPNARAVNIPYQGYVPSTQTPNVEAFHVPQYQHQTLDKPLPIDSSGPAVHVNLNRIHKDPQMRPAIEPRRDRFGQFVPMDSLTTSPTTVTTTTYVNPCLQNPCVTGTCHENAGSYKCKCEPGSWGKNCEQSLLFTSPPNTTLFTVKTKASKLATTTPMIDPCFSNPCMRGKCDRYHNTYRCNCDHGFYGRDCEKVSLGGASFLGALGLNIDACQAKAQPCVNGNCTTANNKVACTCEPGYTGTTCSEVLDHCSSLPCVRGTCVNGTYGFECLCPPGFTGIHCGEIDHCATTPCRHGTCSNTAVGYLCNCAPGYTGTQCEAIDHCSTSPCVRGRCTNRQNEFSCSCPAGYVGHQCEAVDFCFPSPCVHGKCINSNSGYICQCPKGFIGLQCQIIDHCASRPCIRGDCENANTAYTCTCPIGYIGKQCQTIDHCASKPCAHGRCINGDADYQCQCSYAYTGKQCQTVNHCSSSPCARGTCKNSNSGYKCECPPGYTGPQCSTVDHCHTTPCSSGTCLNSNTGYTCILSSGYIGSHLQGNNQGVDHCASAPCVHGSCVNGNTNFVCHCPNGYFGVQCEMFVPGQPSSAPPRLAEYHYTPPPKIAAMLRPRGPDHCASSPCFHGTCITTNTGFQCLCPPGFSGLFCENMDHCASSPCHRGTCVSSQLGFQCNCPPGFMGSFCEAVDHCATHPCVQGECISTEFGFQCNCPPGITGQHCEVADLCASAPCVRGVCVGNYTGFHSFRCECPVGFTGVSCELQDHCVSIPCMHGQCVSSAVGIQCICPPGLHGTFCELQDHCVSMPCLRGTCINSAAGFQCNCPPGFNGKLCDIPNYCASMPCIHGECVSRAAGFQCNCPPGFAGMRCDITDHCSPTPCVRGKCTSTAVGFQCTCQPGFTGVHCDMADNCASSPCHQGGCVSTDLGFQCTCPAGFTGSRCEIADHCAAFPCQRGTCMNTNTGFQCLCPQAYTGVHCEFPDYCSSHPCIHGSCNSTGAGFHCTCQHGFTGLICEVDMTAAIDYCAVSPCVRGTCMNGDVGFLCSCPPRFTGIHCEIDLYSAPDHCASYPCLRGTCTSSEFAYLCTCPSGFTGANCEVDMFAVTDHCASMPCMHGTCASSEFGYICNCPPGYTGTQCEVGDMCANNLCNHGTCVPGVTSYSCQCFTGYSGMNCDVPDGSYCDRNPGTYALCGHGTCASVGSGYECICEPKYNGTHCLFQYECFGGHVCFHDGSCVNNRTCACRPGYAGKHCGAITSHDLIQLQIGDIVTRGKDWKYGNQDGGLHSVGKVISINGIWVNVMWVNGERFHYKMKFGLYELELAP